MPPRRAHVTRSTCRLPIVAGFASHIDRTSLFRIGNFTAWFDLAHALRHPKGAYRVARGPSPQGVERPIAHCAWYDLEQAGRISHVRWDERSQLPLLIAGEGGRTVWRVTKLEPVAIAPEVFRYDVRDFAVSDASQDIQRD
ncbi:MAG TPA: hypothetical protein VMU47_25455 [Caldimonas sp.]|nr:hypothetical protein [Caldimonas sp.]